MLFITALLWAGLARADVLVEKQTITHCGVLLLEGSRTPPADHSVMSDHLRPSFSNPCPAEYGSDPYADVQTFGDHEWLGGIAGSRSPAWCSF